MFNLIAFSSSIASGASYAAVTAATDQSQTISANGKFILPSDQKIRMAAVVGADITAARIDAPSLRSLVLPEVDPVNVGAAVPDRPCLVDYGEFGATILRNEELSFQTSRAVVAAAQNTAGLWISDRPFTPVRGPIFTLVASFTNTLLAYGWSLSGLTFNQTLPSGTYIVVGLRTVCASAIFSRLVFPGVSQYRPGCLNDVLYTNEMVPDYFRRGKLGKWGEFQNTAQPNIEVFGAAAGAQTGAAYLDVIKVK